jgi:hypothetical protein
MDPERSLHAAEAFTVALVIVWVLSGRAISSLSAPRGTDRSCSGG